MVGGPLRFAAHGGTLSDVGWLKANGFDEAGLVVRNWTVPSAAFIHNAGITYATVNCWNEDQPSLGSDNGEQYSGYFQSLKNAGWNMAAGEGSDPDCVRVCMNNIPYVCYGGIVGEQQYSMYDSPWNHPTSGPNPHYDYVECYNNSGQMTFDSCIAAMQKAVNAGTKELGLLMMSNAPTSGGQNSSNFISFIDRCRNAGLNLSTVCFWTGYDYDICSHLKGQLNEIFTGLKNHYGVKYGIAGGGGGGGGPTCSDTPVVSNRHVWIGIKNPTGSGTWNKSDYPVGTPCTFSGMSGFINCAGNWITGTMYTGKLAIFNQCLATGSGVQIGTVWPQANGEFNFTVTASKAERCDYWVQHIAGETYPPASVKVSVNFVAAPPPTPTPTPDTPETEPSGTDITLPPVSSLSSVSPVPTAANSGLSVVLRDHKKKQS